LTKILLNKQEIFELKNALSEVFDKITNLKENCIMAKNIQYPKIPSLLTESLCIHLIKKGIILDELNDYSIIFGGRLCDVLAQKNKKTKKIEVKSTGHSAFQYLGPKDISSDYLVWIHFDNSFLDNNFDEISVFTIKQPRQFLKQPRKLTLNKLRNLTQGNMIEKKFVLDEL